jgi:hypothetical protein
MAFIFRRGNSPIWNLGIRINGTATVRSLRTTDRAEAERILEYVKPFAVRPNRKGCIDWTAVDLSRYENTAANTIPARRNYALIERAIAVLSESGDEFRFLLDPPRMSTLCELGRIPQAGFLRQVARKVIALKMKTVRARIFIQTVRNTRRKVPTLAEYITRAIVQHAKLWPDAGGPDAAEVLSALALDYEKRKAAPMERAA